MNDDTINMDLNRSVGGDVDQFSANYVNSLYFAGPAESGRGAAAALRTTDVGAYEQGGTSFAAVILEDFDAL